ncbi:WD40 repeat-like protein [Leucogyrophana mollusca]|uniref:WD40 repeat-like protein n=1 Tax=Leucogyrophana mollusca TaxID=85980 RepID=A0ACB8BZK7_9AGAM|nr:WD40 repeat-like protein [Leucogyrophana mollusca]
MSTSSIESIATRRTSRRPTKVFKGHTDRVNSVAYFPDGQHIASASWDKSVIIWDVESGRQDGQSLLHASIVDYIAISPDGRRIASGGREGGVVIWDALTRKVVHEIRGDGVDRLAYSPDRGWIATVPIAREGLVRLWDADTGRPGRKPLECGGEVFCVAFSSDGTRIAAGLRDGFFQVIDVSTGEIVVGPIKGHKEIVTSVVYSPDGRLFVTASYDSSIRVWDSKTGIQVGKPMLGHENYVLCISITADGRRIASGGQDLRVWDLETRLQVGDSFQADHSVDSVAFSPDNRYIISNSGDNDAYLWNTESLANQGSSSRPIASKKKPPVRARARSVTSSILDLPAVPEPVVPHQDDSSPSEPERSRGSSFDSILDLPMVPEPGKRRPKKKRPHNTELIHPRLRPTDPQQDPPLEQDTPPTQSTESGHKWSRNITECWQRIRPRKSRVPADIPHGSSHPPDVQPTVPVSPEPPTDTQTQTTSTARPSVPGRPRPRGTRERWERIRSRNSRGPMDLPDSSLPIPLHERPTVPASPGLQIPQPYQCRAITLETKPTQWEIHTRKNNH